jgi:hypothetical protein
MREDVHTHQPLAGGAAVVVVPAARVESGGAVVSESDGADVVDRADVSFRGRWSRMDFTAAVAPAGPRDPAHRPRQRLNGETHNLTSLVPPVSLILSAAIRHGPYRNTPYLAAISLWGTTKFTARNLDADARTPVGI